MVRRLTIRGLGANGLPFGRLQFPDHNGVRLHKDLRYYLSQPYNRVKALDLLNRFRAGEVDLHDECFQALLPLVSTLGPSRFSPNFNASDREEIHQLAALYILNFMNRNPGASANLRDEISVLCWLLRRYMSRLCSRMLCLYGLPLHEGDPPHFLGTIPTHAQVEDHIFLLELLELLTERVLRRSPFGGKWKEVIRFSLENLFSTGTVPPPEELVERFSLPCTTHAVRLVEHTVILMRFELLTLRQEHGGDFHTKEWRWDHFFLFSYDYADSEDVGWASGAQRT